jgi:hypothetical protein
MTALVIIASLAIAQAQTTESAQFDVKQARYSLAFTATYDIPWTGRFGVMAVDKLEIVAYLLPLPGKESEFIGLLVELGMPKPVAEKVSKVVWRNVQIENSAGVVVPEYDRASLSECYATDLMGSIIFKNFSNAAAFMTSDVVPYAKKWVEQYSPSVIRARAQAEKEERKRKENEAKEEAKRKEQEVKEEAKRQREEQKRKEKEEKANRKRAEKESKQ